MKKLLYVYVIFALSLSASLVQAGTRGYKILFIDLTPEQSFKPIFLEYRKIMTLENISNCWSQRKGDWIDIAYIKTQPINASQKTIRLAAQGENVSKREFARLLDSYHDDQITSGFDGAYFATKEKNRYFLSGLSRDGSYLKSSSIQQASVKSLDTVLCSVTRAFDRRFSP